MSGLLHELRGDHDVSAETARVRERVRLLIEITAREGTYRAGLTKAAARLTEEEGVILADLERHGLDVTQLREVLCGAHVLVDVPDLYERWRFPDSRERLSSHHKDVDKATYPDLGFKGPIVREKLHGRTEQGTWVQLEKTPASAGKGLHMPTLLDLQHLMDYVVYRITRRNVGPWGLSGLTEKRPMYLSPDLGPSVPLPPAAGRELTGQLSRIEEADDTTSASPDLAVRFPPPDRVNDLAELVFLPGRRTGRGLFGASGVWVTETPSEQARAVMARGARPPAPALPPAGETRPATVRAGDRAIPTAVRIRPADPGGPRG